MTWSLLQSNAPELAQAGYERLHGRVAYLATVRPDGTPRSHPVTPIIGEGRLFVFMEPTSPKGHDLRRGSAYALHCGVEGNDGGQGEFVVTGLGQLVDDAPTRELATRLSSYSPAERYILFELSVESALGTTYGESGPVRRRWDGSRS